MDSGHSWSLLAIAAILAFTTVMTVSAQSDEP